MTDERKLALALYQKEYKIKNRERLKILAHEHYEKNKEEYSLNGKEYYQKNKDVIIARCAEYQKNNRLKTNEKNRKWGKLHPEKKRITTRNYRRKHKNWAVLCTLRRNALKLNNGVFKITEKDIRRMLHRQRFSCFWCGNKLNSKYQLDHVMPLFRGGRHSIGNLVASCPSCNCSKQALLPIYFLNNSHGLLSYNNEKFQIDN